jgi:Xaa-Pro dipeptidase
MAPRHERAIEVARRADADAVLAAHVSTVTWLTGLDASITTGPSPWAHTPLALLASGQRPVLIVSDDDAGRARRLDCEVVTYPGYGIGALDPMGHVTRALTEVVEGRVVATEPEALPAPLAASLSWVDASVGLYEARAVKDADEIEKLRAAIAVTDAGQRAVREHVAAGRTELEVYSGVVAAMEKGAGGPFAMVADLVSGADAARWEGPPTDRTMSEGELVITDLAPRVGGYWGDSCSTVALGEPGPLGRRRHRLVLERLEKVIGAARPGARAGELDDLARAGLNFPHHTGHGIGALYHEEPRIVPGSDVVLEPNMVIALEPALYEEGGGVRLEWVVLVTPDGCEVLSSHDLAL